MYKSYAGQNKADLERYLLEINENPGEEIVHIVPLTPPNFIIIAEDVFADVIEVTLIGDATNVVSLTDYRRQKSMERHPSNFWNRPSGPAA